MQICLSGSLLSNYVRTQKNISLSSGESELVAMLRAAGRNPLPQRLRPLHVLEQVRGAHRAENRLSRSLRNKPASDKERDEFAT